MTTRVRSLSLLAPLLGGCQEPDESELPPLEWEGERIQFGTDLVQEVCAGTIELLDRDVARIEAELELEPTTEPISVCSLH